MVLFRFLSKTEKRIEVPNYPVLNLFGVDSEPDRGDRLVKLRERRRGAQNDQRS